MALPSASATRLSLSLFRGLLRSARRLEASAGRQVEVSELPSLSLPHGLPSSSVRPTLQNVIRFQFTCAKNYGQGPDLDALHDAGIRALAQLNHRATRVATSGVPGDAEVGENSHSVAQPSPAKYSVGQVFRHRKYGYKAVIVACDETCKASESWIAHTGVGSLPGGTSQPFYHCLVDVRDRPQAQVSYVAQDNVTLLSDFVPAEAPAAARTASALERLILHPLVLRYFQEYRPEEGRYVPVDSALRAAEEDEELDPIVMRSAAAVASGSVSSSAPDDEDGHSSSNRGSAISSKN